MEYRNELFRAIPIFDSNLTDKELSDFSVRYNAGEGLVKYLWGFAEKDESDNVMRTYIVRDNKTDELVGYFSLKAGMISVNETKYDDRDMFDTMPGVELANFAINNSYMARHKSMRGCGLMIFDEIILSVIEEVSEKIGIKLIYIFALPLDSLIERYREYGFKRLPSKQEDELHKRLKPKYDESCIFMYQEL